LVDYYDGSSENIVSLDLHVCIIDSKEARFNPLRIHDFKLHTLIDYIVESVEIEIFIISLA